MASVLCDPNYNPSVLYAGVEPLLFFYEYVYLYAPSQTQIENAQLPGTWRHLKDLIEAGFVIPVGRAFWFDDRERDQLSRHARTEEKKDTYKWGPLDEAIVRLGPSRLGDSGDFGSRSPGYVVIGEEHRKHAEQMERTVPTDRKDEFQTFVRQAEALRVGRALPQELLHGEWNEADISRLAAKLVFYAAGDISIGRSLGVASVFSTNELGAAYRSLTSSFHSLDTAPGPIVRLPNSSKEYRLTPDELQVAWELAKQVSEGITPLNIDMLEDYRTSNCFKLFRDFVSNELAFCERDKKDAVGRANDLRKVFDEKLTFIDEARKWSKYGGAISPAFMAQFYQSARDRVKKKKLTFTRRQFFYDVVAALAINTFAKLDPGPVVERIATTLEAHQYKKLFVTVLDARRKSRVSAA
jgi:hypothetical protein